MDQSIQDILDTIDKAIASFQGAIPAVQQQTFEEIQNIIKALDVKNGNLLNNLNNLKLIGQLENKLQKVIISKQYKQMVQDFIDTFVTVAELNMIYFKQFNQKFTPAETLPIIRQLAVESTINDLLGQGLSENIIRPVKAIVLQNVTSGGSYAKFNEELRQWIIGSDKEEGNLLKYTKQITTDSINQYSAQYQETIAQDLQFNWGRYVGSLIATSREFCVYLTKKQWVHKSELPEIIHGHIDGHNCRLSKVTDLPYGMIPGTNADNFKVRRGGYNCQHQFFWVPDSAVPASTRNKLNS